MSTSGRDPDLPKGWPDVEALSRMANEFFAARPGEAASTPAPADPLSPNSIANEFDSGIPLGNFTPSPIALPGEAELKAVLEAIALASGGPLPRGAEDPIASSHPLFYFLGICAERTASIDAKMERSTGLVARI